MFKILSLRVIRSNKVSQRKIIEAILIIIGGTNKVLIISEAAALKGLIK